MISLDILKILFKTINQLPKHQGWGNVKITLRVFVTELVND